METVVIVLLSVSISSLCGICCYFRQRPALDADYIPPLTTPLIYNEQIQELVSYSNEIIYNDNNHLEKNMISTCDNENLEKTMLCEIDNMSNSTLDNLEKTIN
jgi:hypothetical protein